MKMHRIAGWMAFGGIALLTGCAGMPGGSSGSSGNMGGAPVAPAPQWQTPGPRGGVCDAAPAQRAIGKQSTASVMEKARVDSGAAMARVLRPNQPVTLEFNHERLNLVVDGTGRITAARCG